MRNLKKILALALALMMILSVTASAAFTDAAKIDADYAESVEVLNGMEVFQGYEDGSFGPTKAITRAEVAAIIYRIATADVEDDKVALYVDSTNFPDVKAADWFSGYVGYCTNAGYIKGYEDGTFQPLKTVTGFETLAMILRAMGYDAQNEFSGAAWSQNIAKIATKADILADVKPGQLAAPATREMVAELLFAAIQAETVKYVPAFGYVEGLESLGKDNFGLTPVPSTTDAWGRPGYGYVYNTGDEETYFSIAPKATYYVPVTECEIAEVLNIKASKNVELYVNGTPSKTFETIHALDTISELGAQGRLVEVYDMADGNDRIVMIDTFLAKVTAVKDATYDARGHQKTSSKINLTIYDDADGTAYYATNGKTNYPYAAGDMVLVNVYADLAANKYEARNKRGAISYELTGTEKLLDECEVLGLAKSEVGAQSVIWFTQTIKEQHTVNGTTYYDAAEFNLNKDTTSTSNRTWYFDQYGNIIGNTEIQTQYDYAVLKNIWWVGDTTTGGGKAVGTLVYMDGTENFVTIAKLHGATPKYSTILSDVMSKDGNDDDGYKLYVATDAATNALYDNLESNYDLIQGHLFKVSTGSTGAVTMTKVDNGATTPVHTESTNATILNKYAYITGDPTNIVVDANTKFLVRGTESTSFKAYNGLNELPTFEAGAKVDYVLGTNAAKYVYIIGDVDASETSDFVLVKGVGYSRDIDNKVYYVSLVVPYQDDADGIITLKVKNDNKAAVVDALVAAQADGIAKLFYVEYEDGYAVRVDEVDNTQPVYTVGGTQVFAEKLDNVAYLTTENGNVMGWTGNDGWFVNITGTTVKVGTLETDMTDKVVYVIYNTTKPYMVEKVYVVEADEDQTETVYPADPTKGTVIYTVTMLAENQVFTKTHTLTATPGTYTNATESFANVAGAYWQDIVVDNWTVLQDCAPSIVVKAGETTLVNYVIVAK